MVTLILAMILTARFGSPVEVKFTFDNFEQCAEVRSYFLEMAHRTEFEIRQDCTLRQ